MEQIIARTIIIDLSKLGEMYRGTNITRQNPTRRQLKADVTLTASPFRMGCYCRDARYSNIKREETSSYDSKRSSGELGDNLSSMQLRIVTRASRECVFSNV